MNNRLRSAVVAYFQNAESHYRSAQLLAEHGRTAPAAACSLRQGGQGDLEGAMTDAHRRLWHPWLRIERLTRLVVAARRGEPGDEADHTLAAVLGQRQRVERAGWFN